MKLIKIVQLVLIALCLVFNESARANPVENTKSAVAHYLKSDDFFNRFTPEQKEKIVRILADYSISDETSSQFCSNAKQCYDAMNALRRALGYENPRSLEEYWPELVSRLRDFDTERNGRFKAFTTCATCPSNSPALGLLNLNCDKWTDLCAFCRKNADDAISRSQNSSSIEVKTFNLETDRLDRLSGGEKSVSFSGLIVKAIVSDDPSESPYFLLAQHHKRGWTVPGGSIKATDPTFLDGAIRELKEETGFVVSPGEITHYFDDSGCRTFIAEIRLTQEEIASRFLPEIPEDMGTDKEILQRAWVRTVKLLGNSRYEMTYLSDVQFIENVIASQRVVSWKSLSKLSADQKQFAPAIEVVESYSNPNRGGHFSRGRGRSEFRGGAHNNLSYSQRDDYSYNNYRGRGRGAPRGGRQFQHNNSNRDRERDREAQPQQREESRPWDQPAPRPRPNRWDIESSSSSSSSYASEVLK